MEILIGEQRYSNEQTAEGRALVYTVNVGVEPAVVQRSTYSLAGTAVAIKVSGDPEADNNGVFYIHSDHLGSTSVLSYGYNSSGALHPQAGQPVPGSAARYLPFGGWRTQPTAEITDRGYTGHKHNNSGSNDIGLIYMNARYYSPNTNRFILADTVVPDPTNPQSYNRYSYVPNRALNFSDPTGHIETPYDLGGGGGFGPIDDRHSSPEREMGMMFIRIGLYVAATAAVKEAVDDVLSQARDVINSTPDLENRNKECCPIPLDWPTDNNDGNNRVVWRLMSFGTRFEQFNGRPKRDDWDGLSGTYADQWSSPMEWFEQTMGRDWQPGSDAIYAATVSDLNTAGFNVAFTPTTNDPGHVSIGGMIPGIVNRGGEASWPGNKTERSAYTTKFLSVFQPYYQ